jgi:hypothetical protein
LLKKPERVWGLISQVGCDTNSKVRFEQTEWPGTTYDLSCFCENALFLRIKNKQLPYWMRIVGDEAYSPLSAEYGGQNLTTYSQH